MHVREFVVIKKAASRLNIALTFYTYSNKFLYNFFYSNRINLLMTIRLTDDCPSVIVFIQALHHPYDYSLTFESRVLYVSPCWLTVFQITKYFILVGL